MQCAGEKEVGTEEEEEKKEEEVFIDLLPPGGFDFLTGGRKRGRKGWMIVNDHLAGASCLLYLRRKVAEQVKNLK